jgi:hypothetical protein
LAGAGQYELPHVLAVEKRNLMVSIFPAVKIEYSNLIQIRLRG